MIQIGEFHQLKALRLTDYGWVLQNTEEDEVLLPKTLANKDIVANEEVRVFVFKDSDNRITATMQTPKIRLNEFAFLKVNQINKAGAFLDWGLDKDLLLPYREQSGHLTEGESYVVRLVYDGKTDRLFASMRVNKYVITSPITIAEGEKVDILIYDQNAIAYKAIINNAHTGLVYKNQVFQPLQIGTATQAWVKQVREDKKIDLILRQEGYGHIPQQAQRILEAIEQNNGFLPLHDKSVPKVITNTLQMSKKQFKQAVGYLYKRKLIKIHAYKGISK